jgi:glycosyltransferase involved in cell wall biosynthesis
MQNYGGVTNVIENLSKELNQNTLHGISFDFYETVPPNWASRIDSPINRKSSYILKRLHEKFLPSKSRKNSKIDLRFLGYHFDPFEQFYRDIPLISMVYDFIPERLPEFFSSGSPHLDKLSILERTSLAVCISEETRNDLYRYVPNFQGKSIVIPLASKFPLTQERNVNPPSDRPYLLYVGRRDSYKNVDILLASMDLLPNYDLVLFGGGDLTQSEKKNLGVKNIKRVHCIGGDDNLLQACYQNAIALIFPSFLEGFGLPILEAISLGCLVIASDIQVFHELFGEDITYFDQHKVTSLVEVIEKTVSEDAWTTQLRLRGSERAKNYTWSKAAEIFSESCKDLMR